MSYLPLRLPADQINTGVVSNTEFNFLDGVSSAIQTQIDNKQAGDSTLTALAAFNTNGLVTQTAADTFTGRTVTGTSNRIAVTNGSGVSGNPTLDIDAAYVGQSSITTVGTVSTGTIATRVNPRTDTVASSATPSINTDTTDIFTITALAAAVTSFTTNLTGTPVNGQKLIVRILDNGTARALTWGASFASRGGTLPTTTTLSKYLYVGFIYNSTAAVWDCVAVSLEA